MTDKLSVIFDGYKDVIETIDLGDPFVVGLAKPSEVCNLIGNEIKLGPMVGKGKFGSVYIITVPGKGKKQYVVKKGDILLDVEYTSLSYINQLPKETSELIKAFNPSLQDLDADSSLQERYIYMPVFANRCLTSTEQKFLSISGYHRVPKGSYLCETNTFSEFAIGASIGEAYRSGECINFFNVYSLFTCRENGVLDMATQYIFMDKIDGEFKDGANCIKVDAYIGNVPRHLIHAVERGIFIQLMFAIAFYQDRWKISHNDLHTGNVFVEYVTDETEFNGEKLIEADWYHYHITSQGKGTKARREKATGNWSFLGVDSESEKRDAACDVYFPAIPVITKIGDYGLSVKYTTPIVGDREVFESGYNQYDGDGPWIPNQFIPQYDSSYTGAAYTSFIDSISTVKDHLLQDMVKFLLGGRRPDQWFNKTEGILKKGNSRPVLEKLHTLPTALDLLRSDVVQKQFGKKPNSGKIVTLGVL